VKVYGIRGHLDKVQTKLSETIHDCVVEALRFPRDKRAHRFFHMDPEDMLYPEGRTDAYTIVEITMIEGRSVEAKKQLIRLLFERVPERVPRRRGRGCCLCPSYVIGRRGGAL
jgi:5-carboxymethyl-2-hydroxymuconate isomerase